MCAAWQGGLSGGICVCLGAYVFKRAFVWLSRIILPAVRMLLGEGEGLYERQNQVFVVSLAITIIMAIWAVAFNANFTVVSNAAYSFLTNNFGWLYLMAMTAFVIFPLQLLSVNGERLSWDRMTPSRNIPLFPGLPCCLGLAWVWVWYSGEYLSLWRIFSPIPGIEAGTEAAANFAIRSSYMHWGLHPWANYCIIGLGLAYFQFRKGKPGLISSIFEPLIGEKGINGWVGKTIDVLAVFATVAGVVTSLGLGVMQINAGLNYLFGIPTTLVIQIIIIAVISVIYIWSAVDGISRGIKIISDANLYIAIGLITVTFLVGPKLEILNNLTNGLGQYLQNFFGDSLMINNYGDNTWVGAWRVFYWAWWIAWAPFVGSFIARISKGRTIREFIAGVVLAPALGSILWFAIMGSLGLHLGMDGTLSVAQLADIASKPETGLFIVMGQYPLGMILCVVSLILLCTFFITSANSGTFVLAMFSSKGDLNPKNGRKVLWGVVQSLLAVGLLVAGGLKPLQTISLAAAFPFIFIMLFAGAALVKALMKEK